MQAQTINAPIGYASAHAVQHILVHPGCNSPYHFRNDNLWFQQPNCKRRHIHVCNPDLYIIRKTLFHSANRLPEAQPLSEYTDSDYKDTRHINIVSPQAGHGSMRDPSCYSHHNLILIKQLQLSKERDEQEG